MTKKSNHLSNALCSAAVIILAACSSMKTPATADVAVSKAAVYNAASAGGAEFAPAEMSSARAKLTLANKALADKDYKLAASLAGEAETDAKLAQSKANSAKAQVTTDALYKDIWILREEVYRANQTRISVDQARTETLDAQMRNAQLEAQLAELRATKNARGMVITLGDVLFGSDMSHLTGDGMRTVERLAYVLQQNPQRNVLIEGFTDSTGSASYNLELSSRRAGAVSSALQSMGVARERIVSQAYGKEFPIASNETADSRQLNRRVEIVLSDDSGKIGPR